MGMESNRKLSLARMEFMQVECGLKKRVAAAPVHLAVFFVQMEDSVNHDDLYPKHAV